MNDKEGKLVIISSPSGGGKDSVINSLLKTMPNSVRLVTTTSRPMRPGNKEGRDYYFITQSEFKQKISQDEFVEYNIYSDNYYGTQKKHLEELLKSNALVFTQMEVNGKQNLDKQQIPHLSIFLLPENLEVLRNRISKRGGLKPEQIENRLEIAKNEIRLANKYDYQLVNEEGKLEQTISKVKEIIEKNV